MRKLNKGGRCGIVLPDGVLSAKGVYKLVKMELLKSFNVHTIISLPPGTFAYIAPKGGPGPKASLVFFDKTGPTEDIWYYELVPPKGANYTKSNPIKDEDLIDCWNKWQKREVSDRSWVININQIKRNDFDIAPRNIRKKGDFEHIQLKTALKNFSTKCERINQLLNEVILFFSKSNYENISNSNVWKYVPLKKLLRPVSREIKVDHNKTYRILGMHSYGEGLFVKYEKKGSEIKAKKLYQVKEGDFIYNRLFGWRGAFAVVTKEFDGCYVSNEFPCFTVYTKEVNPFFLWKYFSCPLVWSYIESQSTGTTRQSRLRFKQEKLLEMKIPIPPLDKQKQIVELHNKLKKIVNLTEEMGQIAKAMAASFLIDIFYNKMNQMEEKSYLSKKEKELDYFLNLHLKSSHKKQVNTKR